MLLLSLLHILFIAKNPVMSASEDIWKGGTPGVKLVRTSLLLRLSKGEEVGRLLEEMKGNYSRKLRGWPIHYRSIKVSTFGSSGRWMNVEGEFAVFKPVGGLKISTTFMNLEDGQALCRVMVRVLII